MIWLPNLLGMAFKIPFSLALGLLGVAFFCALSVRSQYEHENTLIHITDWPKAEALIIQLSHIQESLNPNPAFQDHRPCIDSNERVPLQDGDLISEDQTRLNELASTYLGRFCQAKRCYFHDKHHQFLCRSSSIQPLTALVLGLLVISGILFPRLC